MILISFNLNVSLENCFIMIEKSFKLFIKNYDFKNILPCFQERRDTPS